MDVQPPDTVVLDLGYEEESLLAAMKAKTRYNIGLAAKKGVRVEEGGAADLPAWYELYRQTARRDRITLHDYEYYRRQFELAQAGAVGGAPARRLADAGPELKLLLARHEGDLLAGILLAVHGRAATYLYGASSDAKRNLMPAYALQWEAIRIARRQGCLTYDLFGIPPSPDPAHPMHGLYRFKTGFGGRLVNRPGCWDFPYRRAAYAAYAVAERARAWYYRRWRKARFLNPSPDRLSWPHHEQRAHEEGLAAGHTADHPEGFADGRLLPRGLGPGQIWTAAPPTGPRPITRRQPWWHKQLHARPLRRPWPTSTPSWGTRSP